MRLLLDLLALIRALAADRARLALENLVAANEKRSAPYALSRFSAVLQPEQRTPSSQKFRMKVHQSPSTCLR